MAVVGAAGITAGHDVFRSSFSLFTLNNEAVHTQTHKGLRRLLKMTPRPAKARGRVVVSSVHYCRRACAGAGGVGLA